MSVTSARALRYAVCGCVAAAIGSSPIPATQASAPVRPALVLRSSSPERVLAPTLRPKHIPVTRLRADRRGDTPLSSKYFKLTNLTAEVGGFGGSALAVNDDGRIAYDDDGNGEDVAPQPYIVSNGGMYDALTYPLPFCEFPYSAAYAVNEHGQAAGLYGCSDDESMGDIAWTLYGESLSYVDYFDQRSGSTGSYIDAENDRDVAAGCDGACLIGESSGSAALFTGSPGTLGRVLDLRGLEGKTCYATATAINNAGGIVGFACNEAVRFSTGGYAKALPVERPSAAEGINPEGDIAGYSGKSAFLYHRGMVMKLPLPAGFENDSAIAYGINAKDEIVGSLYSSPATGPAEAFLYANGHAYAVTSLLPPNSGWTIADAYAISDRGEIVGDGYYNGNLYGVSLKPPQGASLPVELRLTSNGRTPRGRFSV